MVTGWGSGCHITQKRQEQAQKSQIIIMTDETSYISHGIGYPRCHTDILIGQRLCHRLQRKTRSNENMTLRSASVHVVTLRVFSASSVIPQFRRPMAKRMASEEGGRCCRIASTTGTRGGQLRISAGGDQSDQVGTHTFVVVILSASFQ